MGWLGCFIYRPDTDERHIFLGQNHKDLDNISMSVINEKELCGESFCIVYSNILDIFIYVNQVSDSKNPELRMITEAPNGMEICLIFHKKYLTYNIKIGRK